MRIHTMKMGLFLIVLGLSACGGGNKTSQSDYIASSSLASVASSSVSSSVTATLSSSSSLSSSDASSSALSSSSTPAFLMVVGVVVDDSAMPIEGALVSGVGTDKQATTRADGTFSLELSTAISAVLRVEKAGYMGTVKAAEAPDLNQAIAARIVMPRVLTTLTFNPAEEAILRVPGSVARVNLPTSSLVDSRGQPATGEVTAQLTPIDPSKDIALMPGLMVDANSGNQIESLGALSVQFTDANGAPLNLASGQAATIRIPATPAAGVSSSLLPQTFPLYHLNETNGLWFQEGIATLQTDQATGKKYYEGSVSHFSTWNADSQIAGSTLNFRNTASGSSCTVPAGARLVAQGLDYNGTSFARGDVFFVRPDSSVQVLLVDGDGTLLDELTMTSGAVGGIIPLPRCLAKLPSVMLSGRVTVTSGSLSQYRVQLSGSKFPTDTVPINIDGSYRVKVPINRGEVQAKLVSKIDRGTPDTSVSIRVADSDVSFPDLKVNDSSFELSGCVKGWETFRLSSARVSLFKGETLIAQAPAVSSSSSQFQFSKAPLDSNLTLRITTSDATLGETSVQLLVGSTPPPPLSGCLSLPQPPVATFQVSGTGLSRHFDAGASTSGDASITGYTWDFGDGSIGEGLTLDHAYAVEGTYTVSLQVKDALGQVSKLVNTVIVSAKPPNVPSITPSLISVGDQHACAVRAGTVWCWGNNDYGQLGNGTKVSSLTAIAVQGLSNVAAVAAGGQHTCALTADGDVYCWGNNVQGSLGIGSFTASLKPVVVPTSDKIIAISVKNYRSCALDITGIVACWGQGNPFPSGVQGTGNIKSISTGELHTCAVTTEGAAKCWGANFDGQVGMGFSGLGPNSAYPVAGLSEGVASVSSSKAYSFALLSNGTLQCWGRCPVGPVSIGPAYSPVVISTTSNVAELSAGGSFICTILSNGAAQCFGSNWSGELGNETLTASNTLVNVSGLSSGVVAISAGTASACALTNEGSIKCWGSNWSGQLGNGTTRDSSVPVNVLNLP